MRRTLRIKIDYVVLPRARDVVIEDFLHKLAVGVDDREARAGRQIPRNHVPEKRTLPRTRRSKYRHVLPTRFRGDRKHFRPVLIPVFVSRTDGEEVEHWRAAIEF